MLRTSLSLLWLLVQKHHNHLTVLNVKSKQSSAKLQALLTHNQSFTRVGIVHRLWLPKIHLDVADDKAERWHRHIAFAGEQRPVAAQVSAAAAG